MKRLSRLRLLNFFQYCEYYPDYEGCKKWLEENMPEKFSQMSVGATETEEDAKKRQKRGGKGMMKVSGNIM